MDKDKTVSNLHNIDPLYWQIVGAMDFAYATATTIHQWALSSKPSAETIAACAHSTFIDIRKQKIDMMGHPKIIRNILTDAMEQLSEWQVKNDHEVPSHPTPGNNALTLSTEMAWAYIIAILIHNKYFDKFSTQETVGACAHSIFIDLRKHPSKHNIRAEKLLDHIHKRR